jgi:peptidoglycan/LPS O-acetylase OafA/YrhL
LYFTPVKKPRSLQIIESGARNSSVDIFRAFAIFAVVLFHFNNFLPYGYVGVDLFFVISGLLVGGLLIQNLVDEKQIHFFKFILQRGFKIWPSYYVFLILANVASYFIFSSAQEDRRYIQLWEIKRYLFFYQNYTGRPFHVNFDHVWSLCVEEHFYILLPIMLIIIQKFFNNKRMLVICVVGVICAGILFKYLALVYTNSKDTYAGTHNRIDALAWGVLLSVILVYFPSVLKRWYAAVGLLLFIFGMWMMVGTDSVIYRKVIFHSLMPFCFFLMIAGLYYVDFSKLKVLRLVAYYSYNWYLWQMPIAVGFTMIFGNTTLGLLLYVVVSFAIAVIFTILVEEPFLRLRKKVIPR